MNKWTANDNCISVDSANWQQYAAGPGFAEAIVARHNAEIKVLEAERDQLTILLNSGTCIYCLETFSKDSDLAAHIHSCPSHPLGKALARAKAAEAERDEYRWRLDAVVGLLEGDDEDTREFLAALHAGAKAIAEGRDNG